MECCHDQCGLHTLLLPVRAPRDAALPLHQAHADASCIMNDAVVAVYAHNKPHWW